MASYKTAVRKLLNRALKRTGYAIGRKEQLRHGRANSYERLHNLKTLGFAPTVIFDCGAYVGQWTIETARIFPDARFLLIEPNPEVQEQLHATIKPIAHRCTVLETAVGERAGTANLNLWAGGGTGSSLLANVAGQPHKQVPIKVCTLNDITAEHRVVPEFVKLDLQGYELPALRGGGRNTGSHRTLRN
jgi:FkbM family methyltransferase